MTESCAKVVENKTDKDCKGRQSSRKRTSRKTQDEMKGQHLKRSQRHGYRRMADNVQDRLKWRQIVPSAKLHGCNVTKRRTRMEELK